MRITRRRIRRESGGLKGAETEWLLPHHLSTYLSNSSAEIDLEVGSEQRQAFVVEAAGAELRRRRMQKFLTEMKNGPPAWIDEDHPELVDGSGAWVRKIRAESEQRMEKLEARWRSEVKLLFDTTVLIDALRKRPYALALLDRAIQGGDAGYTSAMNVAELYGGLRGGEEKKTAQLLITLKCLAVTEQIAQQAERTEKFFFSNWPCLRLAGHDRRSHCSSPRFGRS